MIQKIKTNEVSASYIVEVTPDDLITVARRMHLEASKALPGEEIMVHITDKIMLKYNPEITTSVFASRVSPRSLPGTEVATLVDNSLKDTVLREDNAEQQPVIQ